MQEDNIKIEEIISSILFLIFLVGLFILFIGTIIGNETACRIAGLDGIGSVNANCIKYFIK